MYFELFCINYLEFKTLKPFSKLVSIFSATRTRPGAISPLSTTVSFFGGSARVVSLTFSASISAPISFSTSISFSVVSPVMMSPIVSRTGTSSSEGSKVSNSSLTNGDGYGTFRGSGQGSFCGALFSEQLRQRQSCQRTQFCWCLQWPSEPHRNSYT